MAGNTTSSFSPRWKARDTEDWNNDQTLPGGWRCGVNREGWRGREGEGAAKQAQEFK